MNKECFNCKCHESDGRPLMPEGFYDNLYLCHSCWNSDDIRQWRINKQKTDPRYRRYIDLISTGFKVNCPNCGKETNRNPKYIGHSPCWELCCTKCSEIEYTKISPYRFELSKWLGLYDQFIRGILDLDEKWNEVLDLDSSTGIPKFKCKCGGEFSMVAKPRCSDCRTIVVNSIFHVCDDFYGQ